MRRWLPRFLRRDSTPGTPPPAAKADRTLELLVVEGPDAGSQFTVDGESIPIGRGETQKGRAGAIGLRDPSVSPQQAVIRVGDFEVSIEHCEGAASPTLVNERVVARSPIGVGDRIRMGRTLFEVRSRPGISLSGLMTIPRQLLDARGGAATAATTEIRRIPPPSPALIVLRGIRDLTGRRFPLAEGTNRIGRHPENDVVLPEQGVSRFHAELVWKGSELLLVHRSSTNPTYVEGRPVTGSLALRGGETLQLADRVALRIERPEAARTANDTPAGGEGPGDEANAAARVASLKERMEEKIRRDEEIEREFGFIGSFLDVDVVDSHGLKVRAARPEHIVVSFERFRSFAQGVVEEHKGHVLNSNGDELMCFFEEPLQSVQAALAILERLEAFNARENLLGQPFRVRQGIHTGRSLVDRRRGVAYSPVLDVAGHLQKHAPADGLLVSAETLAKLPDGLPFSPAGELGREKVSAFRYGPPPAGTGG